MRLQSKLINKILEDMSQGSKAFTLHSSSTDSNEFSNKIVLKKNSLNRVVTIRN